MVAKNNPAGRLFSILSDAEIESGDITTLAVWTKVFDLSNENELEIIRNILSLQELVEEVYQLVEENPELNSDLFLKSFPSLQRAVSAKNLAQPWRTNKIGINSEAMTRLEFCSEVLEKTDVENVISDEELDNLKNTINDVVEYVENSSITYKLKIFIMAQLESIRRGLFDYKIHGSSGLRNALGDVIGSTVTQNNLYGEIKREDKSTFDRLGELLDIIDNVVSKSLKVKKILGQGSKLLGLPWFPGEK